MTRRPPFWLAALALSCATSKSAESQLQLSGKEETQTTAVEHREFQSTEHEGPWRVTTYNYATPKEVMPSATADERRLRESDEYVGLSVTQGVATEPERGPLLSVVVEDHFGRDITAQSSSDGYRGAEQRVDVKADAEAHSASSARLGLSLWAYALIGLVLAALAAAAWKFKPPFLSFLWKLL